MPVFGLLEIIFFGVFFLLLVIGTALDRRYHKEAPKWFVLVTGIVLMTIYYWSDLDLSNIWSAVRTVEFWKPVAIYVGAGLVYSVFEFILSVRKMARAHKANWEQFINSTRSEYVAVEDDGKHTIISGTRDITRGEDGRLSIRVGDKELPVKKVDTTYREIIQRAQMPGADLLTQANARGLFDQYKKSNTNNSSWLERDFVEVIMDDDTGTIQPVIDRSRLASFIGAWTMLWPAYAVSLVLGDFLTEVFRAVSDLFANLGGRFVRFVFGGVFTV